MTVKTEAATVAATPGASGDDPRLAIVLTYFKHLRACRRWRASVWHGPVRPSNMG